jgi:ABC-type glycerol-3-phosphate transport system substrate-binding protein
MKASFQAVIIFIFIFAFVAAVAIFSGIFSSNANKGSSTPEGRVLVWGTLDLSLMQKYVAEINGEGLGYTIEYVQHDPDRLVVDITNALADNIAPDLVLFPSELLLQLRNRLYAVPFAAYSERTFRDTFVDGASVFLSKDGILAMPLFVDPMVTYYNKNLLAGANFVTPPQTWTNLAQTVPLFTRRDARGNLTQSTIALGESQNIPHASDILSALFLQTGTPIVEYDPSVDTYAAVLNVGQTAAGGSSPAAEALTFYTSFANPTSAGYTWNRSLPDALSFFLSGRSAFYLGRASELFSIQQQNPNLNFDVQLLFQPEGATRPVTFGSFTAVGMLKAAPNPTAAYAALGAMARAKDTDFFSKTFALPPARRDLLQVAQQNPYVAVFFRSTLGAFAWPDPNAAATRTAFRAMITSVNSGTNDANSAINEANSDLQSNIR